jgi:hypothetical protein
MKGAKDLAKRFLDKVNVNGPIHPELKTRCWLWTAYCDRDGYGQFTARNRSRLAHRTSYELFRGAIPKGLTLDHLCRNRSCVNPDHLEPVTKGINTLRGYAPSAINKGKQVCKNGHPLNAANTYTRPDGDRACRKCNTAAVAAYKQRRKLNRSLPA